MDKQLDVFRYPPQHSQCNGMAVVLVTGATGGVGQEVVRELLSMEAVGTVRCLVRDLKTAKGLWPGSTGGGGGAAGGGAGAAIELRQGDITDPASVAAAVAGADTIVMAHSRRLGEAGASAEKVDYAGTVNVCEAARSVGTVSRLVVVTSNSVSLPGKTVVCMLNWMGGMGMAYKLRAEGVVRSCGVPYVIVRPVGLKDDSSDRTAVIQQTEHGLGRISRTAVGPVCARACMDAPANSTLHCSGVLPADGWCDLAAAFGRLRPDDALGHGVQTATFEEHEAATSWFAWKVRLGGAGACAVAIGTCIGIRMATSARG